MLTCRLNCCQIMLQSNNWLVTFIHNIFVFSNFYVSIAMYCLDVMKDSLMTTKFLLSENVEAEYGIIGSICVHAIWIVIENRIHLKFSYLISEYNKINTTAIKKALTAEVMLLVAEKLREQHLKVPICLERAHKSRVEGEGWFIWQSRIKSSAWFVKGAQACQKVTERQTKH